jgi:4-hydroxy-2-oxoglutarate aldolase
MPTVPPRGVWCPAVTFFDPETDALNLDAQSRYFKYLSRTGLAGLVVLGTNAETFLLTRDGSYIIHIPYIRVLTNQERRELVATARKAVGPEFPLMVGVGGHSTRQVLEVSHFMFKTNSDVN